LGIDFLFEGGLDFDASDQLFGVDQGNSNNAKTIKINTVTGAATILGPTPGEHRDINGLAFDGQTFYAIDRISNTFGSVDPTTGAYIPIGNPGPTLGDSGGLAIDPADGTIYATFSGTGGFYTIDKRTGAATLISPSRADYGLAFAPGVDLATATKTIVPSTGSPGTPLTCTITLGNSGVANMTNVQITDSLPLSLTYVGRSLTATGGSYGQANGVITWTGTVRANAAITVTFGVAISDDVAPGTIVTNTAIIRTPGSILERSAAVTVRAGDEPPETSTIYLPLVLCHQVTPASFPLHVGDAIPARAVAYRGEIFYTQSVLIPSSLPAGGHFYFSSSPSRVSPVLVDDDLVVLLHGTSYFAYHFSPGGQSPQSAIVEVPRATMEQLAGQTAHVEYRDVYAHIVEASSMWLIWTP
jgi:uncharacterized repeat protein (TIGR01451 family)